MNTRGVMSSKSIFIYSFTTLPPNPGIFGCQTCTFTNEATKIYFSDILPSLGEISLKDFREYSWRTKPSCSFFMEGEHVYLFACVWVWICVYILMCMAVCMPVSEFVYIYGGCMHICIYVSLLLVWICKYVCMCVLYECMHVHICVCVGTLDG